MSPERCRQSSTMTGAGLAERDGRHASILPVRTHPGNAAPVRSLRPVVSARLRDAALRTLQPCVSRLSGRCFYVRPVTSRARHFDELRQSGACDNGNDHSRRHDQHGPRGSADRPEGRAPGSCGRAARVGRLGRRLMLGFLDRVPDRIPCPVWGSPQTGQTPTITSGWGRPRDRWGWLSSSLGWRRSDSRARCRGVPRYRRREYRYRRCSGSEGIRWGCSSGQVWPDLRSTRRVRWHRR